MRKWLGLLFAVFGISCSAQYPGSPSSTPALAAIRIHYSNPHEWISPGNTEPLTLYAINTDGVYEVVNSRASWFSSNTAVVSVTNTGVARGVSGGVAEVVASYQGHTSAARIVVLESNSVRFPWLDIRPFSNVETSRTVRAVAAFFQTANSASRDVSGEATWTSSDPNVLTVAGGNVTAIGPGTASITANFNGLTATSYASVPPIRTLP